MGSVINLHKCRTLSETSSVTDSVTNGGALEGPLISISINLSYIKLQ